VALLSLEQVSKRHRSGRREVVVLDSVSLVVEPGDYVGIWGAPRSGKSSLLRLAAGIEPPDAGVVRFDGKDLARASARDRALVLRRSIGYVSTRFEFDQNWRGNRAQGVVDQVAVPLISDGWEPDDAVAVACRVLDEVGARDCLHATGWELSPGERTRVALARALIRKPRLLLVDEPALTTSPGERDAIRELLRSLLRRSDLALIVASEDVGILRGARHVLRIGEGGLLSGERPGTVVPFPLERTGQTHYSAP
jgi:putative ABC transport system ATP-binding protein